MILIKKELILIALGTGKKTHFATADSLAAVFYNLYKISIVLNLFHAIIKSLAGLRLLHISNDETAKIVCVKVVERENIHNMVNVTDAVHVTVNINVAVSYSAVNRLDTLDVATTGRRNASNAERLFGSKIINKYIVKLAVKVERRTSLKVYHCKGTHHCSKFLAILVHRAYATVGKATIGILYKCLYGKYLRAEWNFFNIEYHSSHHPTKLACSTKAASIGVTTGTCKHHIAQGAGAHTMQFINSGLVNLELKAVYLLKIIHLILFSL